MLPTCERAKEHNLGNVFYEFIIQNVTMSYHEVGVRVLLFIICLCFIDIACLVPKGSKICTYLHCVALYLTCAQLPRLTIELIIPDLKLWSPQMLFFGTLS